MCKIALVFVTLFGVGYAQLDHFTFEIPPGEKVAGVGFRVKITARDEAGNVVEDFHKTATLSTTRGDVIEPTKADFLAGRAEIDVKISLAADAIAIICRFGGVVDTSAYFRVVAGPPAAIRLEGPPAGEPLTAGVPYDALIVKYTDRYGNIVAARSPEIRFSSSDPFAQLPPPTSILGVDTFSITLRQVSLPFKITTQRVVATAEGLSPDTIEVRVNPGEFKTLLLLAPGDTALPGDTTKIGERKYPGKRLRTESILAYQDVEFVVYAVDECWNEVIPPPPAHQCSLYIGGPHEVTPKFATLRSGGVRFMVRFTPTPPADLIYGIRADDMSDPTYSGRYFSLYRIVTAPAAIFLSAEKDTVDEGVPTLIKAKVTVDILGRQGYPRVPVEFEVLEVEGGGKVEPDKAETDGDGVAKARFTGDKAGRVLVVATYFPDVPLADTLSDTLTLEVRTAKAIWAAPNPFTEDEAECEIRYKLTEEVETVVVLITDIFGNLVRKWEFPRDEGGRLVGMTKPGIRIVPWDGKNLNGQKVANGVYLVRIKPAGEPLLSHRIVVIR